MTAPLWSSTALGADASGYTNLGHIEWCNILDPGIPGGVATQAERQQLVWGFPGILWEEGSIAVPRRGAGGGRKRKRSWWITVGGDKHRVSSQQEVIQILEQYENEVQEQIQEAPKAKARRLKISLAKARGRLEKARAIQHREMLMKEDEELIQLLAA